MPHVAQAASIEGGKEYWGLQLPWILTPDTMPSCKITLTLGNIRKSGRVSVIVIHDVSESRNLELYSWQWEFACKDV